MEAFKVMRTDIGQFLSSTLRPTWIHLNCIRNQWCVGPVQRKTGRNYTLAAIFLDNVPYSLELSVFLRHFVFFEAFMVVRTQTGQFLSSTLWPTSILLHCVKKSATCGAGAEKNRKEEITAAIFSGYRRHFVNCHSHRKDWQRSSAYDSISAVTICCRCREEQAETIVAVTAMSSEYA